MIGPQPFNVAALFVRADSSYKSMRGVDAWDEVRDASRYLGPWPVVAHPPCRGWGRLRHLAKVRPGELALALFAVDRVRRFGGVLEHPASSQLWQAAGLPRPGERDAFGGFTYVVHQSWWGHRAPKATWLYVVGVDPSYFPAVPFHLGLSDGRVELMGRAERERTPERFATWLVELARRCGASAVREAA